MGCRKIELDAKADDCVIEIRELESLIRNMTWARSGKLLPLQPKFQPSEKTMMEAITIKKKHAPEEKMILITSF